MTFKSSNAIVLVSRALLLALTMCFVANAFATHELPVAEIQRFKERLQQRPAGGNAQASQAQGTQGTPGGGGTFDPANYFENRQLIRAPNAVGILGSNLFGDNINIYRGSLEFVQTDVNLEGNNTLPVSVSRRLTTGGRWNYGGGLFSEWELEIPHMHGTFITGAGWKGRDITGQSNTLRCSNFNAPADLGSTPPWRAREFWSGNFLSVPGYGTQEVLTRAMGNSNIPTDLPASEYKLVTKDLWAISCLSSLASNIPGTPAIEQGEGFLAVAPNGTRYRFDWLVSRPAGGMSKQANAAGAHISVGRSEVWILPTVITDRFGNTVTYTYDTTDKWKLLSIQSSDGRNLTFSYVPGTHRIQSVTDGIRTWTYGYADISHLPQGLQGSWTNLVTVTLPDGTAWDFSGMRQANGYTEQNNGLLDMQMEFGTFGSEWPENTADCDLGVYVARGIVSPSATGVMVHPSGAVGTFTLTPIEHGRSGVPQMCFGDAIPNSTGWAYFSRFSTVYALTEKTISGPGLPTMSWRTSYDTWYPAWDDCNACTSDDAKVRVTDPEGDVTVYTFGNVFNVNEGLLLRTETGGGGGSFLRASETRYITNRPVNSIGTSGLTGWVGSLSTRHVPQDKRTISQQGASFVWEATAFDGMERPISVTRSSSLGFSRIETTVYSDHSTLWVLGQIGSVSSGGLAMLSNEYHAGTATLTGTKNFGKTQYSYTYRTDGTLETRTDGRGFTTRLNDWKRGIPQTVLRPNGTSRSAVVNDIGRITSLTDELNNITQYSYDLTWNRLSEIRPPSGWAATGFNLQRASSEKHGLPSGHWQLTESKGDSRLITYLDALYRPVVTSNFDAAEEEGTRKVVIKRFDSRNKVRFESYPRRCDLADLGLYGCDHDSMMPGVATAYDPIGRITSVARDTQQGLKTSYSEYLSDFKTRLLNPRGFASTQGFWALDNPEQALLENTVSPEGVNVKITRDIFGKPTSIRRWGSARGYSVDVARSYIYDTEQLLCKTLEPEVVATVLHYDGAGNISWRAPGVNLPSGTCDRSSVAEASKIAYDYDEVNQLRKVTYGDASPEVTRTYWEDGQLKTISSSGSKWTYQYNALRKLTSETLDYEGRSLNFSLSYNTKGDLTSLSYPAGGGIVTYSPNALGEPRQVGNFASNVAFHPNGAVAGFTYGNLINHSLIQTVEGTPRISADDDVLKDVYTYDANGNVIAIDDQRVNALGGRFSRTMEYDDLDRLRTVSEPSIWGVATYVYDPVDNLRTATVGSRVNVMAYGDGTNRLTSLSTNGTPVSYLYDVNGNVKKKGGQDYIFDLGNRLKQAAPGGSYTYDGHGRRIKIQSSDGTTRLQLYSLAGQLLWSEKLTSGNTPASVTYTCSTGILVGQQCVTTTTYQASVGNSCNAGDSLSGSTCTHILSYSASVASYSCPSGGTLSGSTCTIASSQAATPAYSCPSGGELNGTTCTTVSSYAASENHSCPNGWSLSGSTCTSTSSYGATASYSCPNGWSLDGTMCRTNSSYGATPAYGCPSGGVLDGTTCRVATTYGATLSYSCPGGGGLSGTNCNRNDDYAASSGGYSCNAGDSLSGSTCTHIRWDPATPNYSCPAGYTLSGTTCTTSTSVGATPSLHCNGFGNLWPDGETCIAVDVKVDYIEDDGWAQCEAAAYDYGLVALEASWGGSRPGWQWRRCRLGGIPGGYSCPNGGTLNGNQCVSASSQAATLNFSCNAGSLSGDRCAVAEPYAATATYSCPSGGSLDGTTCRKTTTYAATASYSCPSGGSLSGTTCGRNDDYAATFAGYTCPNGGTLSGSTCTVTHQQAASSSGYSCPSGGALSGSTCIVTQQQAATFAGYTCPSGGTLSGSICVTGGSYAATFSSYSCPSGWSLSGSNCTQTSNYTATANYHCPSGGSLSGTTCTQTSAYPATVDYTCNAGDSRSGTTCEHTSTIAAITGYSCPNGGTLSGSQCIGAGSADRTAYIYLAGKQIAETVVGGATQYVHTDALGSPVAHTNAAKNEINRTKYEPYGFTAQGTKPSPATSSIGYTGHVNDADTDLVYMQQRYYDPIAGRFLSIDPITADANTGRSFGRYVYANNSPYVNVDPDGLDSCTGSNISGRTCEQTGASIIQIAETSGKSGAKSGMNVGPAQAVGPPGTAVGSPGGLPIPDDDLGELGDSLLGGLKKLDETLTSMGPGGAMLAVGPKLAVTVETRLAAKLTAFGSRNARQLKEIYMWGNDVAGARAARLAFDHVALARIQGAVTREEVMAMREFYVLAQRDGRGGQVAVERARYMNDILQAWK